MCLPLRSALIVTTITCCRWEIVGRRCRRALNFCGVVADRVRKDRRKPPSDRRENSFQQHCKTEAAIRVSDHEKHRTRPGEKTPDVGTRGGRRPRKYIINRSLQLRTTFCPRKTRSKSLRIESEAGSLGVISRKSDQLLCHAIGIRNEKTGLPISANFGMWSVIVGQYRNTLKLGLEQWKVESPPIWMCSRRCRPPHKPFPSCRQPD